VGFCVVDLYDRLLLVLAASARKWDLVDQYAQRALGVAERLGSPVWTARVCADWADAVTQRGAAGDLDHARVLRARALEIAQRLGMPGLCSRLAQPATQRVQIVREGELWRVSGCGASVHVKASRGIEMLARLVEEPGRELHVLDLAGAVSGDAGPLLDARARDSYRERLRALSAERERAEQHADLAQLQRLDAEVEALSRELERAFGLSGRERKAGSASERARSNVQRRISHAIEQVRAGSEPLALHLGASVRTGAFCCYAPKLP
jgi:hypothetical protein